MKRRRLFSLLLALLLVLTACAGENSSLPSQVSPSSLQEEQSASEQPSVEAPQAELNQPDGTLLLYRYLPDAELYEAAKQLPMPASPTVGDVFFAVASEVLEESTLPKVNRITMQKSYVTIDLGEEWLDRFSKGELNEFCNSLVMTMRQNGVCESVGFRIDGEVGLLGGEVWQPAELRLIDSGDPESFTAIRQQIPYTGIKEPYLFLDVNGEKVPNRAASLQGDETADQILRVLALAGDPGEDFDTPAERDGGDLVLYLLWATNYVTIDPNDADYDVQTAQILLPLAASVSERLGAQEDWFWLREHIEETARILYGDAFSVVHRRPSLPYKWFETEGVYTPPHMGGGWSVMPYLYRYTEENNVLTAEVAYLIESYDGVYDAAPGEERKPLTSLQEVDDCLARTAKRRTVTLHREADGRLTLQSHHFISNTQQE